MKRPIDEGVVLKNYEREDTLMNKAANGARCRLPVPLPSAQLPVCIRTDLDSSNRLLLFAQSCRISLPSGGMRAQPREIPARARQPFLRLTSHIAKGYAVMEPSLLTHHQSSVDPPLFQRRKKRASVDFSPDFQGIRHPRKSLRVHSLGQ